MGKEQKPTPSVSYYESFEDPDVSYSVKVNKERVGEFLETLGLPNAQIESLRILVRKSNPGEHASFEYGNGEYTINVYGDDVWEDYVDAMEQAMRLAYGLTAGDADFADLLYTDKLDGYLRITPAKRGLEFASKLLLRGTNRKLNSNLSHELGHLRDKASGRFKLWFMFGELVDLLPLINKIDPIERSADAFELQFRNHHMWRDLIVIEPKKKA